MVNHDVVLPNCYSLLGEPGPYLRSTDLTHDSCPTHPQLSVYRLRRPQTAAQNVYYWLTLSYPQFLSAFYLPCRPFTSSMPLNLLACRAPFKQLACRAPFKQLASRAPFKQLACRTSIRMASTIVGKSGRVYVQGELLHRHHKDHKFSIFKAEYGLKSMPSSQFSHISDQSQSGPGMSLLSSSACLGLFTICPYALQPNWKAPVGFESTSIVTKRKAY